MQDEEKQVSETSYEQAKGLMALAKLSNKSVRLAVHLARPQRPLTLQILHCPCAERRAWSMQEGMVDRY